jgi:anti-anti-sigma factor
MNSVGLSSLIRAYNIAKEHQKKVVIIGGSKQVKDLFFITKLNKVFNFADKILQH